MILQKRLIGRLELDVKFEKLGITLLKTDAFGLMLLVGIVLIITGPLFLYLRYEDRLATMQKEVDGMKAKVSIIDETMKQLKEYDLRLNLLFPENDPANPLAATLKVNAYVRKKGEPVEKPYDQIKVDRGFGGIVVQFDKLSLGDKLFVIAEDGSKKWRSDDMITPAAYLKMQRIAD